MFCAKDLIRLYQSIWFHFNFVATYAFSRSALSCQHLSLVLFMAAVLPSVVIRCLNSSSCVSNSKHHSLYHRSPGWIDLIHMRPLGLLVAFISSWLLELCRISLIVWAWIELYGTALVQTDLSGSFKSGVGLYSPFSLARFMERPSGHVSAVFYLPSC